MRGASSFPFPLPRVSRKFSHKLQWAPPIKAVVQATTPKDLEKNLSEKNSQQTNSTHVLSRVRERTRVTLRDGEWSHQCANPGLKKSTKSPLTWTWSPEPRRTQKNVLFLLTCDLTFVQWHVEGSCIIFSRNFQGQHTQLLHLWSNENKKLEFFAFSKLHISLSTSVSNYSSPHSE